MLACFICNTCILCNSEKFKQIDNFILKLFGCLFYELIIQVAIWFIVTFFIIFIFNFEVGSHPHFLQFVLWLVSGAYFIISWSIGGQTLAMRAWKLKLITPNNNWWFFYVRYIFASAGLFLFFISFIYVIFNKERKFAHDLILGSKIINVQF